VGTSGIPQVIYFSISNMSRLVSRENLKNLCRLLASLRHVGLRIKPEVQYLKNLARVVAQSLPRVHSLHLKQHFISKGLFNIKYLM
jgi:hypothetical protein